MKAVQELDMDHPRLRLEKIIQQLGLLKESDFSRSDSLTIMSLILELEQAFQIEIQFQEINESNLLSFDRLESFILKKINLS